MSAALEAAIAELVLGPELAPGDARAVGAFFERHGVAPADREALLAGELERLLVYRKLVRSTLADAIELAMPRARSRLGPDFERLFAAFLAERAPRTHYLRDVASEFLEFWATAGERAALVPRYLLELARLEALHITIAAAPTRGEPALVALELDAGFHFDEACVLADFAFAVHELSETLADRALPRERPTHLLVYRSPDHNVRYLELSPLARALLGRLIAGESLRRSLLSATGELAVPLNDDVLNGAATLIADLVERGVVLGARRASATGSSSAAEPE